jgi:hypothetical protein
MQVARNFEIIARNFDFSAQLFFGAQLFSAQLFSAQLFSAQLFSAQLFSAQLFFFQRAIFFNGQMVLGWHLSRTYSLSVGSLSTLKLECWAYQLSTILSH